MRGREAGESSTMFVIVGGINHLRVGHLPIYVITPSLRTLSARDLALYQQLPASFECRHQQGSLGNTAL